MQTDTGRVKGAACRGMEMLFEGESMGVRIRARLHHLLNPLHVYCRLRSLGVGRELALRLAELWEKVFFRRISH